MLLATWPGVGNVSLIVSEYILHKLSFKNLGTLDGSYFFDPIGVTARNNVVQAPQFPENRFYYRKGRKRERDVILFVGEDQQSPKVYELAQCVLDVGRRFRAEKVITCAAALTQIHFTEQPKVWGVATKPELTEELARYDLVHRGNLQIAGLNGLLLGVAKEKGVDGFCLLGEVPAQASQMPNPMAALAILQVLSRILGFKIDTAELSELAQQTKEQIKYAMAVATGEYIEHFTQPIWQREDSELGNGDEDDDDDD